MGYILSDEIYDLIFDPGHGGADPGAVGTTTKEKDNVLVLAKKTAAHLVATGRFRVKFTRDADKDFCNGAYNENLDLKNRVAIANDLGGDAFFSFHNNSAASAAYGNEVYAVAPKGEGEKIAKAIRARMAAQLDMVDRGVKFAGWYVCKWTDMPGVLVEYGFINSEESVILAKMDLAALTIAQGIGDYFGVNVTVKGKEEDVLKVAVLLFSKEDYWSGTDVVVKNGNCALFIRPADRSVPADAMSAEKLIVVGGSKTGHPNEVLLSGNDKYDTAVAVKKYLG